MWKVKMYLGSVMKICNRKHFRLARESYFPDIFLNVKKYEVLHAFHIPVPDGP